MGYLGANKKSYKNHFILKCLGKRNCRKGIIWNSKGDEEDFSFTLESVGEGELLPSMNQELSFLILNLLNTKKEFKTIRELANETSFNEEHTRRICKKLFLEKEDILFEEREHWSIPNHSSKFH